MGVTVFVGVDVGDVLFVRGLVRRVTRPLAGQTLESVTQPRRPAGLSLTVMTNQRVSMTETVSRGMVAGWADDAAAIERGIDAGRERSREHRAAQTVTCQTGGRSRDLLPSAPSPPAGLRGPRYSLRIRFLPKFYEYSHEKLIVCSR